MAGEWDYEPLSSLAVEVIDCDHRTPKRETEGMPYVTIPEMKDGRIDLHRARRISRQDFESWTRRALPQEFDVVLSRRTNPGETAVVRREQSFALGQNLVLLRSTGERVHPPYVYWVTKSPAWWREVSKFLNVGAIFDSLRIADIRHFRVPTPPFEDQVAIAAVLGALDDKIELNRRMSETLERMAGSLFDRWFVDGEDLPNNVGDAVPAVDWAVQTLDSIADFLNGAACQKFPALHGGPSLPVIKIRELTQGITSQSDRVTKLIPEKWHVRNGDVLFSWSGTLLTKVWTGGPAALNQHLFKVTSAEYPRWFYLRWVLHHLGDFRGVAADKATTMGHIKRHHLSDAMCRVPPASTLEAMTELMEPLLDRQIACENESSTLAAIRDTLLPKLISGELRIPDAERLVSEVT